MTNKGKKRAKDFLLTVIIFVITGCAVNKPTPVSDIAPTPSPVVEETATEELSVENTVTPEFAADPFLDWQVYTNENFQLSIKYPPTWFGPDVYEVDDEIRLAIGSDQVYPYGTDRTEQIYTVENAYYITIQYRKNPGYSSLDEYGEAQPWLSTYLSMLNMEDGETISTQRALDIREREVEIGRFKGLEYIATLSETAQTEPFYARQIILFDENLNVLMVMGTPNNVEVGEDGNWREAFQDVDQENLAIFRTVLELITVE